MHTRLRLGMALLTTLFWGLWGALLNLPAASGFPETLGYVVWSLTMIPPAVIALSLVRWRLDYSLPAVTLGLAAGLLGAGGQLVLFKTVPSVAPAYLVFPFIALNPIVTILMAWLLSRERVHPLGWLGIYLALVAAVMLNYQSPDSESAITSLWAFYAAIILLAWGVQGYVISYANRSMKAESIFFYMALSGVAVAPLAWAMTDDFSGVNWGWSGPGLSAAIQTLNSLGALLLVYAYRFGKAMIVAPLINAGAPVLTAVLSLILLGMIPSIFTVCGIVTAVVATACMALEETPEGEETQSTGAQEKSEHTE